MKYLIAKVVFFLLGWSLDASKENIAKAKHTVMIAAPHTSNWDLIFALGAFWLMRLPIKFFIKDFYTQWYFFGFFKWLGGIGVDRSKRSNLVDHAVRMMNSQQEITLMVPAEGTRKRVEKWKTGFYHIAQQSGTNISLGFLDYQKKHAGILKVIAVNEFERTMDEIQSAYASVQARHPEWYNTTIY
jgi:1-acyl-sn-glycerol-3-phosphate acyltransferase